MYNALVCNSYQNACIMYKMFKGLPYDQYVVVLPWLCVDHVEKKNCRGLSLS